MEIQFTTQIFKEGRTYVAYARELDISSCGSTKDKAARNLKEAVRLFLEQAELMGTLKTILAEAGYKQTRHKLEAPKVISVQRMSLPSADACQSLVRFLTNNWSRFSRPMASFAFALKAITWF